MLYYVCISILINSIYILYISNVLSIKYIQLNTYQYNDYFLNYIIQHPIFYIEYFLKYFNKIIDIFCLDIYTYFLIENIYNNIIYIIEILYIIDNIGYLYEISKIYNIYILLYII